MGRVQGSKIRSQSVITAETQKKEKKISAKKWGHNIIEIPVMNSFDKKMSLSTLSKICNNIWLENETKRSEEATFEEQEQSK